MSEKSILRSQDALSGGVSEKNTVEGMLATCPPEKRARYRPKAIRAARGSRPAATKLKCLDCVCWEHAEIARCEIRGCPLWGFRRLG